MVLGFLKDKIKANIQNWTERNVSRPTNEILIKMVAQALPAFAMNVFLLPSGLVKEIENGLSKKIWSNSQQNNSKICWMAWIE